MNLFFETQNPKSVCSLFSVTCVAWRFCRAGCTSSQAAKFAREACKIEWCPISLRFLCPCPPLLLSAPNQNCHATQATPAWKKSLSGLALTSSVINYTYERFQSICVTFFVLFWLAYIFYKHPSNFQRFPMTFLKSLFECLNVWMLSKQGCSKNFWAFAKLVFCDAVKGPKVNMKWKIE